MELVLQTLLKVLAPQVLPKEPPGDERAVGGGGGGVGLLLFSALRDDIQRCLVLFFVNLENMIGSESDRQREETRPKNYSSFCALPMRRPVARGLSIIRSIL